MGKTTVSNMFRDIGVPIWCADKEVSILYSKDGVATKIFAKEFPNVVMKTGVDKVQLRTLIHKDINVLRKVENIVHPLLHKSKGDFMERNQKAHIIIFDIPLLFEKNQERKFDAVAVVTASEVTQKNRVLKRENMSEKDFLLIKRNQLSEEEKLKRADFIINTDKVLPETRQDVQELYKKIKDLMD